MQECVDAVLDALEGAGFSPQPKDANMGPAKTPGLFYESWWQKEITMPNMSERGVLGLRFSVVENELQSAVETGKRVRSVLRQSFGLRLTECRITGFSEGDKPEVHITALVAF